MAERLTPAVRRERILDVAMRMLDADGPRSLTLRALARACDMTAPGLMHHFPTLDHLLVAVLEHRDERDQLESRARMQGDWNARTVMDQMVEGILAHPHAARLFVAVQADAVDPEHPGHAWFREHYRADAAEFAELFGHRYPDAERLAVRCMAAIDGLQLQYLADPAFDLRAEWSAMADALLGPAQD